MLRKFKHVCSVNCTLLPLHTKHEQDHNVIAFAFWEEATSKELTNQAPRHLHYEL